MVGAAIMRAEAELARDAGVLVPIHGDPVPGNVLVAPHGIVLIDWDFAGMGDPAWDLAYFALEAELVPAEEHNLLASHAMPGLGMRRFMLNKMVAAALAGIWGTVRMRDAGAPDLSVWISMRGAQAAEMAMLLYSGAALR